MLDLVWIVGGPTSDNRDDLRHSLRTVATNLHIDYRHVWVVGDCPAWLHGVRTLPLTPLLDKFENQRQSITAYVNHPDGADQFVLFNDDIFVTEPSDRIVTCHRAGTASTYTKPHRDAVAHEGQHDHDCWACAIIDTTDWVAEQTGTDPLVYECHAPLRFDTAKVRDLLERYPTKRRFLIAETYPMTGSGGIGENLGNSKCAQPGSFAEKLALPMPYLSCSPETWAGCVGDLIRRDYPTPSRWETPVLDVNAIKDQKRAVGLVENPCCWRLEQLAAHVPADQAIVELGAFKGRTTGWLALGANNGNHAAIYSVDPWETADKLPDDYRSIHKTIPEYSLSETRQAYEQHLIESGVRSLVTTIQATAVDAAARYDGPPVGLLWHDALHRREDVRDDLQAWLPHLADNAVIALHDVGDPRFAVEAGAADVLDTDDWDWAGRDIQLWPKQPAKRGYMVVRRVTAS